MKLTLKELQAIETEIVGEISRLCSYNNIDYYLHCGSALGAVRHGGPIPWDSDVDIIIPINQFENFLKAARKGLSEKFFIDYYDTNNNYPTLFPRIGIKGYSTFMLHVDIFRLVGVSSNKNRQKRFSKKAKFLLQIFRIKTNLKEYYGNKVSLKMRLGGWILKPVCYFIPRTFIIRSFERLCNKYPYDEAKYVTNLSGGYGTRNVQKKSIYGNGTTLKYSGFDVKVPERYHEYLEHYYGDYMQLPATGKRKIPKLYELKEI